MLVINPNELKPCDMLFYHADSFIGNAIRYFDGGRRNHVGLWTGKGVAEAVSAGYKERGLDESIASDDLYVDVVRWSKDRNDIYGTSLGTKYYPYEPVLERINYYLAQGERYQFESLLMLALVCEVRKISSTKYTRKVLDEIIQDSLADLIEGSLAVKLLDAILAKGKEPLICSEAGYRCFNEAGEKYSPTLLADSMHNIYSQRLTESELLKKFSEAKLDNPNSNFVTPNDLFMSPNFCLHLGRLKYKHLLTSF